MTRITKLRMQGFKSFARLTELIFPEGFSTFLGANGAGKTNISDSICFVLGKSSSKEMRAERASHLIYNGGKKGTPSKQAIVEIFFDNSKNEFPIKEKEVKISRILKQTGQSIYKINDEVRTRQQVLDLLNTSNIDPEGHNIILQGDIERFTKMKSTERRQIIEEIAGISVYEDKKEKSRRELEKVQMKLNEAEIILTERETNLRELKKDRDQALKYKELEEKIKNSKATFIDLQIKDKQKKKQEIESKIKKEQENIEDINKIIGTIQQEINKHKIEINNINQEVEEKGEKEQLSLRRNIEEIKTTAAKYEERLNTCNNEIIKIESRKKQLKSEVTDTTEKINSLKNNKKKLQEEIKNISKEIPKINENLKILKQNLSNLIKQKEKNQTINEITGDIAIKEILSIKDKEIHGTISQLGTAPQKYALALEVVAGSRLKSVIVDNERIAEKCIKNLKQRKLGVVTFLPLNKIKSKFISEDLKKTLKTPGVEGLALDLVKFDPKYKNAFSYVFGNTIVIDNIETARKIGIGNVRMVTLEGDLIEQTGSITGGFRRRLFTFGFKDTPSLNVENEMKKLDLEINKLENKKYLDERRSIELNSEIKNIDIQLNSMLIPESDKSGKIILQQQKEKELFQKEINELTDKLKKIKQELKNSELKEKKYHSNFKNLINKRHKLTEVVQQKENKIVKEQSHIKIIENNLNNHSINKAKIIAEIEALFKEFEQFKDGKIRRGLTLEQLKLEIFDSERELNKIGNVNLRALEVYETIEKEYKNLLEKASKLKEEKEEVLNMISEIESKKKGAFIKVYKEISNNFQKVFSELSTKGSAHLELEDPENPFNAGIIIKVKIIGNKYLDIHSLSGGEKSLTALAFIFAIQEYKPASFYLLDEVDAALDKRNSETLSKLIRKYSKLAQYIVISHNDAIITEADQIYGVSMQDNISKIVSLKI
jgi:chromosome segregation protein